MHNQLNIREKLICYIKCRIPDYVHKISDFDIIMEGGMMKIINWNIEMEIPSFDMIENITEEKVCNCIDCILEKIIIRLDIIEQRI
jgi:hypothetical protein